MENNNNNSFFDPKNIMAIALVAVVWMGWQTYLSKKYPHSNDAKAVAAKTEIAKAEAANKEVTVEVKAQLDTAAALTATPTLSTVATPEQTQTIDSEKSKIILSSQGMGFKSINLNSFTKREGAPISFGSSQENLFGLSIPGIADKLNFSIIKVNDNTYEGTAQVGQTQVISKIEFNFQNYSFTRTITVLNATPNFKEIQISLPENKQEKVSGGFLIPSYDHQEFVVNHEGKREAVQISEAKENITQTFNSVSIIANASQYFTTAILDKSEIIPETLLKSIKEQSVASATLIYKIPNIKDKMVFKFIGFAGPKSHDILESVDSELTNIVDFGYFSIIGKFLLVVLKLFNNFVGNWGVSIILLTLLVRLAVLPFNMASTKSMKKMQKIQPQMQAIRERYKEDPQTLQRETMALMKNEKVNPLGGCLPMLLQMPIFFALFRVLGQSIELYQAPFMLWIHDLSIKDPFYVLPILMGITLFIQQKTTPTTMDPQQAKVMQFMPILFSFMMVSLPSGLTLYTFISTLFGVVQQQILMRDKPLFSFKKATA